ncbi:MAG: tRNA (adenosine(37)-N6)-threonylcarbamoyltransferase complex dimerization subunit type 1 TsaB [Actinobacteria bacterium]|nr:tRNA (adenosine(37)-N6)-threonylcarbamoyltransferase complex dimerization subunit type 1 TsaB [Actinomycetota bacterium]
MLVLGIETATPQVGCALGAHEGVLASFHASRGRRHAETLVPAIDFICRQARVELDEIGAIAADVGPGLFTGLRVGVVTAKAMALALRVPVIGVSSLDLLAFPVRWTHRRIVSVVDARRGEVFYGFYRQVPGGVQRLSEHRIGDPEELCSEILATGDECLAVGDGALRYAEQLQELTRVVVGDAGLAYPSAGSLVQLAHARALREEFINSWELAPVYLRKADAEINWTTREDPAPQPGPSP